MTTAMIYFDRARFNLICAAIFPVVTALAGCSSPKVTHSLVLPETRQVQAWAVILDSDIAATDGMVSQTLEREFKSQYAQREYAALYVNEVAHGLQSYGYHLVDNAFAEATICIRLIGQKWADKHEFGGADFPDQEDYYRRHHHKAPEADPVPGATTLMPIVVKGDHVAGVHIEIITSDGISLGQADIAASGGGLKPGFIAEVVNKLLQTGSY